MTPREPWSAYEMLVVVLVAVVGFVVVSVLTPCLAGLGHGCGGALLVRLAAALVAAAGGVGVIGARRWLRQKGTSANREGM